MINKLSQHYPKIRHIQFLIPILIYLFTVVLWVAQPFQTSYFAPRVRPPNYEVYPYSDAMFYSASAENVLNGNGFLGWGNNEMLSWQVTPRPYYISLLAYFIFLAQDDYFKLIFIQTLLLALIPVTGFIIGKKIHGNALGVFIALLLIFKEINTIQATQYISVSQSKLLLADQPTQLVVLGLSLIVIMYLQATHNKNKMALVTGRIRWIGNVIQNTNRFIPALHLGY